uniref:Leucine-rich repeat and coiled-coil domain-containing protein 1 n=1 Tax=Scophthalmus maximus TaxID=52904 RepID=A0A8D3DNL0_SCOMX
MGDKELSLIDKNITSLLDIPLSPTVTSLNLHCNHIPRIEGLTSAWHLRHLDLSSNCISKIEGLTFLTSLRTLNLSCNLITKVEGLKGLVNLTRLSLSYNQINDLTGLLYLHGSEYKLKHLSLHSNHLDRIDHLLQCLLGLQSLREVTLSQDGRSNPVCGSPGRKSSFPVKSKIMAVVFFVILFNGLLCLCAAQTIVEERDQERERRWKAEQAVRKLMEELKCLQTKVSEEKDLQSMMKRQQDLENKAAALKRELDIQRASVRQHRDKLQQLHELLASREQEHRKQLESRLQPGGADFCEAVAKEVASVEQRLGHREAELQEKLADGRKQYAALEDEFRMALTIEAARFSEVKEACDQMATELMVLKASLGQSQQREKRSGSLVQELTAMVKEQKSRIAELIKAKRDTVNDLKSRLHSLEAEAEQDRRLSLQLELLKKDKARLLSQLTAQESVIDGLRAERRIWGQELAQQGVSLAQDRGRLEARIEVLSTELETQKKQNVGDNDALKIKAKIIDDQTETIRKLKEALQERDDQIRRLREEAVQAQKRFQQQQEEDKARQAELRERLEHLSLRKEELKQQLEDKETELEEIKRKWQEKADLLTRLESQVKRMKENFDSKERSLLEERDKATEAQKAAVEKLHCVDDAFRRQLESVQAAHQAELLRQAHEKQKQIERANQKVFDVEDEMRQLLEETETTKRLMEEKMKRLTSVLKDF